VSDLSTKAAAMQIVSLNWAPGRGLCGRELRYPWHRERLAGDRRPEMGDQHRPVNSRSRMGRAQLEHNPVASLGRRDVWARTKLRCASTA